jgi:hypothetical protein
MTDSSQNLFAKFMLTVPRVGSLAPLVIGANYDVKFFKLAIGKGVVDVFLRDDLKLEAPPEELFFHNVCCYRDGGMIYIGGEFPVPLNYEKLWKRSPSDGYNNKICSMALKEDRFMMHWHVQACHERGHCFKDASSTEEKDKVRAFIASMEQPQLTNPVPANDKE